jgi:hypothetical protein
MSYSYDRTTRRSGSSSTRRGTFSYWVPLALTVTVATVGIAAWIWSERNDDDDEESRPDIGPDPYQQNAGYGRNEDGSVRLGPPSYAGEVRQGEVGYGTVENRPEESQSYMARMSGALRRTPSPQQVFDGVSRTVVGGVAAAGAVVGTALSSIREEDKSAYKDHERWSEEAALRRAGVDPGAPGPIDMRSTDSVPRAAPTSKTSSGGKRKTVAIVVSAEDSIADMEDDDGYHEHAVCTPIPALRKYSPS